MIDGQTRLWRCFALNLSYGGVFKTPSFDWRMVDSTPPPPQFLFVKTIEKVIKLCTVLIFLSDSFVDMGVFQLSFDGGGGLYRPITDR